MDTSIIFDLQSDIAKLGYFLEVNQAKSYFAHMNRVVLDLGASLDSDTHVQ